MNITLEKVDAVNAVITAEVAPADYEERFNKAVKNYRKNANMPGFRKGMVPVGLIKKQFGPSILVEEVFGLLRESLYNYVIDNKVNMLGEPFGAEENNNVNIVEGGTFTFKFELALAPEFEVNLSKDDKISYYNVTVSDEMVNKQVDTYCQRNGEYQKVDEYQDNDMIKGTLTELDKENAIVEENEVMLPKYFKSEDQKALFAGVKVGDTVTFNPSVAYEGSEMELASLMHIEKEKVGDHKGDFTFKVTEITRFVPSELNEKVFNFVYPDGSVKTAEEFTAKVRAAIEDQFAKDSDYRFVVDLREYLTAKVGTLTFPEEKLRKIMLHNAEGDEKKVEENYEGSIKALTWHLIQEKLVEQTGVKVEDSDVKEMARDVTRMQFAQYGLYTVPDEYIDSAVAEKLKKRSTVDSLVERCVEVKLGKALKDVVTLDEKSVTQEEFGKLFEA